MRECRLREQPRSSTARSASAAVTVFGVFLIRGSTPPRGSSAAATRRGTADTEPRRLRHRAPLQTEANMCEFPRSAGFGAIDGGISKSALERRRRDAKSLN